MRATFPTPVFCPVRASGLPSIPNRGTVPLDTSFAMAIVSSSAAASSKRRKPCAASSRCSALDGARRPPSSCCAFPRDGAAELRGKSLSTLVILLCFDACARMPVSGMADSCARRIIPPAILREHATASVSLYTALCHPFAVRWWIVALESMLCIAKNATRPCLPTTSNFPSFRPHAISQLCITPVHKGFNIPALQCSHAGRASLIYVLFSLRQSTSLTQHHLPTPFRPPSPVHAAAQAAWLMSPVLEPDLMAYVYPGAYHVYQTRARSSSLASPKPSSPTRGRLANRDSDVSPARASAHLEFEARICARLWGRRRLQLPPSTPVFFQIAQGVARKMSSSCSLPRVGR
ncbi:hypothetical protein C8Q78DRAFT_402352 [Trametes maxima]|nr:hypothetical protein C8Q78DRAFT_402352 [Trametes maxima]